MAGEADNPQIPPAPPTAPEPGASSPASNPNMVGRRMGQYVIQEKIGQGGMGLVFRAFDTALERTVALKVMFISPLDDPRHAERFMREARSLARLSHPHLLHVYNVGQERDCFYFAMELLNGETLFQVVQRRRRVPANEVVVLMGQILSALHYVHGHGITHRDIKSGNIMLCDNRAVLMDFGLAKDEHYSGLTSVGVMLGTPDYMAPEAADGAAVGPTTDIYSLGVVMFEALCGRLPFMGRSAMSIIRQHMETAPPRIEELVPGVNPQLARVVYRCLEKKPAARYPDCIALARDLVQVQHTSELDSVCNAKPVTKGPRSGPVTAPSRPPQLDAFDPDSLENTVAIGSAAAAGRAEPGQSLITTEQDLSAAHTLVATKNLQTQSGAVQESKAWPVWAYAAIGFFGVFLAIFALAILGNLNKGRRGQPWQGQSVVRKRPDGTGSTELRWIEFRNGDQDPSRWEHVIETRQPDGTWVRLTVPHREFIGGPLGEVLEFKDSGEQKKK